MKPFSEEEPAEHRRVGPKREGLRRIAVFAAAPLGLYAALVVVSLLGGPRIGAPFIPLPGMDKPGPVNPVAGLPLTGEAMELLPPIPRHSPTPSPLTSTPTMVVLDQLVEPTTATGSQTLRPTVPPTVTPTPTTAPTTIVEPDDRRSITLPSTRPVDDPKTPPATRTPPPPTADPTSTTPPTTPTEPPGDPDEPEQPTLIDTLRDLLDNLPL